MSFINVIIGLILLFTLLSLLASSIQETIAGWFSLRGRMLDYALQRMLAQGDADYAAPGNTATSTDKAASSAYTKSNLYEAFRQHAWFQDIKPCHSWHQKLFGDAGTPSYLDGKTFTSILLHVIEGKKEGQLKASLQNLPNGRLKRFLLDTLEEVDNDMEAFRTHIENWYDNTMDRASGWYKRQVNSILLVIGFFTAVAFNADVFAVYQSLSLDPEAQAAVAFFAEEFSQQALPEVRVPLTDSTALERLDSLQAQIQLVNQNISQLSTDMGLGWSQAEWQALKTGGMGAWISKFLGFIVCTFAISLGAPFWFDILQKFINFRNTGVVPKKQ